MISNLDGSLGSRYFINVANERTCFASCARLLYSLSRKTVNTRENFLNVYCFATNQMLDETAKDNRQTAAWSCHDLTRNNKLAVSSSTSLHVYRYQMLNVFFFYFGYKKVLIFDHKQKPVT